MSKQITCTFTITTSKGVMERFKRFLALLHWNSRFGHSSTFAMFLDGDGNDQVTVEPEPGFSKEVNLIGAVGHEVEIAGTNNFSTIAANRDANRYSTASVAVLKRGDEVIQTEYESGVMPEPPK